MKPIKVYNLCNANGDALTLRLGYDTKLCESTGDKDTGLRWSFEGKHIPMPIRANTWFNGFPEPVMLNWLKRAGWALRCVVDMPSGKATVYDLPTAPIAKETDWIPVCSGAYPKDKEAVQITYLRHPDNKPQCDAVAFRYDGNWCWNDDGTHVAVKVTAWRPYNPYKGDATAPATEPESKADTNTVYFIDYGDGDLDSLGKFTCLEEAKENFSATAYGAGYPNVRLYKATEITKEV